MIWKMFSIQDAKVGTFSPPQFFRSAGEAMRVIGDTLASGESMLSKHPEDFSLFEVGEFDDQTSAIATGAPRSYGTLVQFMPKPRSAPLLDVIEGKRKEAL